METFEFVMFNGKWTGKTFGCDCCSDEQNIETKEKAIAALVRTAKMYESLAKQYSTMAECARAFDIAAAYKRWTKHLQAIFRYRHRALAARSPGKHGSFGRELVENHTEAELLRELELTKHSLHPEDEVIANAFGWGVADIDN